VLSALSISEDFTYDLVVAIIIIIAHIGGVGCGGGFVVVLAGMLAKIPDLLVHLKFLELQIS